MNNATNTHSTVAAIRAFAERHQYSATFIRLNVWAPSAGAPRCLDIEEVIPSITTIGPWHPADIAAHFAIILQGWVRQGATACSYTLEALLGDQPVEATLHHPLVS